MGVVYHLLAMSVELTTLCVNGQRKRDCLANDFET